MKKLFNLFRVLFSAIRSEGKTKRKSAIGGQKKEVYAKLVSAFTTERFSDPGISHLAIVCATAIIDESATVSAGSYIGSNVKIGKNTRIFPNATILNDTIIGRDVIIGSGTVIGGEGFGYYEESKTGNIKHVPQLAKVIIEDEVYIGSNCSINRGSIYDTQIGQNTKINCNVHIAHNVIIGNSCLIMASASINGSTKIGNKVVINPHATISKHVIVGDSAIIGMNATVLRDVAPNTRVLGSPATEK